MIYVALTAACLGFAGTNLLWWLRCRQLKRQLDEPRVRIFVPPPEPPPPWFHDTQPRHHKELHDEN